MSALIGDRADNIDVDALTQLQEALPYVADPDDEQREPIVNYYSFADEPVTGDAVGAPKTAPTATEIRGFGTAEARYCIVRGTFDGPYVALAGSCEPLLDAGNLQAGEAIAQAAADLIVRNTAKMIPPPWNNPASLRVALQDNGALGYLPETGEMAVATATGLYVVQIDPVSGSVSSAPVSVEQFPPN